MLGTKNPVYFMKLNIYSKNPYIKKSRPQHFSTLFNKIQLGVGDKTRFKKWTILTHTGT